MEWRDVKMFFGTAIYDDSYKIEDSLLCATSNIYLIPVRYLLNGQSFEIQKDKTHQNKLPTITLLSSNDNDNKNICPKKLKTTVSVAFLVPSLLAGGILKGLLYFNSPKALNNHKIIKQFIKSNQV